MDLNENSDSNHNNNNEKSETNGKRKRTKKKVSAKKRQSQDKLRKREQRALNIQTDETPVNPTLSEPIPAAVASHDSPSAPSADQQLVVRSPASADIEEREQIFPPEEYYNIPDIVAELQSAIKSTTEILHSGTSLRQ